MPGRPGAAARPASAYAQHLRQAGEHDEHPGQRQRHDQPAHRLTIWSRRRGHVGELDGQGGRI